MIFNPKTSPHTKRNKAPESEILLGMLSTNTLREELHLKPQRPSHRSIPEFQPQPHSQPAAARTGHAHRALPHHIL